MRRSKRLRRREDLASGAISRRGGGEILKGQGTVVSGMRQG